MADHGKLQPASQAVAVDRGNHGLGAGFDGIKEPVVLREQLQNPVPGRHVLDLGDVGPGDEVLPRSGHDDRLHGVIPEGLRHRIGNLPHKMPRELIDRRVVQHEHGDTVPHLDPDRLVVRPHLLPPPAVWSVPMEYSVQHATRLIYL